jgi:hypothetical protein
MDAGALKQRPEASQRQNEEATIDVAMKRLVRDALECRQEVRKALDGMPDPGSEHGSSKEHDGNVDREQAPCGHAGQTTG